MNQQWVYDGEYDPSSPGWYGIQYCWDAQEGVHIGAGFWTGGAWTEQLPIVAWIGPCADSSEAYNLAAKNDPDGAL